jgi:hypothetical protein
MGSTEQTAKQLDRWVWAVVSAMALIIFTGGTTFLTIIHSQVQALESHVSRQGERLASLETQNTISEKRLERIEQKIDQLLETRMKANGNH